MFNFGKKKNKGIEVGSPVKGKAVAISNVSDPTFGEEILGKGVAIMPAEGKIYEKLIGLDGLPIFRVYQINNSQKQPAYAEQNIVDRLVERVDRLEKQIGGMNHEPDADNGNVTEQR